MSGVQQNCPTVPAYSGSPSVLCLTLVSGLCAASLLFLTLLIAFSKYFPLALLFFFFLLVLEISLSLIICPELALLYPFPTSEVFFGLLSSTRVAKDVQKDYSESMSCFFAHLLSTVDHTLFKDVSYFCLKIFILIQQESLLCLKRLRLCL